MFDIIFIYLKPTKEPDYNKRDWKRKIQKYAWMFLLEHLKFIDVAFMAF